MFEALSQKLSRVARPFLSHKCTLIRSVPVLDGDGAPVIDDEGHPTYTTTSESNVSCLMLWREENIVTDRGTNILHTPILYLSSDTTVSPGDIVQDVTNRANLIMLVSAKINTVDTTSEMGQGVLTACELEGASV